ncbi:MAG: leucine--tRNA ligase [Dehalococcoidia bacterium]
MEPSDLFVDRYPHQKIEQKWQNKWFKDKLYKVNDKDDKPKWYELTMYPYPSGDMHIGHWYAMTPSDTRARFRRMQGYNVLHPMGFDAFGLPAENAAIKHGIHPYKWTMQNIENMRRQLKSMGTIYDWDREIVTCKPDYYKWNQWVFLQLYKSGLAYRSYAPANWCDSCNTVLANEQVLESGLCERCDTEVIKRDLNQWFFKITQYADELLDQSKIDWPEKIKSMQMNWIGKSEGIEISFDISEYSLDHKFINTFTTRIDTIFGVTFIVIAPEHPLVTQLTTSDNIDQVKSYIYEASKSSEIERLSTDKDKTGVFTGSYCINRLNGDRIPIFVADYVLLSYGTGVVMGVPAHDQRDYKFAKKYKLEVKLVVEDPSNKNKDILEAYLSDGSMVNSGKFDGLSNLVAKNKIADYIENRGYGKRSTNYKMRDWLISRQRYWGTPIPIIYCNDCGIVPVPEKDLPVLLPENAEFLPTGESPLSTSLDFVNTICPNCNLEAKRETDTMDTFVDSSWYFFRYLSPNYKEGIFDRNKILEWGSVDQYTGGAEHAVMHLLYSRFFVKALRDLGLINIDEPFKKLFNQGHIISGSQKMSKSKGNVVSPDEYVNQVGSDVVRCYLMFIGPWDQGGEWSDSGLRGMSRWINRVWEIFNKDKSNLIINNQDSKLEKEASYIINKTIRKVTEDLEKFKFNTSIASLMELTNWINEKLNTKSINKVIWNDLKNKLIILLAPFAPHMAEELWYLQGYKYSVHNEKWPQWSLKHLELDTKTIIIQVNGKFRDKINVTSDLNESEIKEIALQRERVNQYILGKEIKKIIYIKDKLINCVVN